MNSQMRDVTFTARDGQVTHLDTVYIRGSKIRFVYISASCLSSTAHTHIHAHHISLSLSRTSLFGCRKKGLFVIQIKTVWVEDWIDLSFIQIFPLRSNYMWLFSI